MSDPLRNDPHRLLADADVLAAMARLAAKQGMSADNIWARAAAALRECSLVRLAHKAHARAVLADRRAEFEAQVATKLPPPSGPFRGF